MRIKFQFLIGGTTLMEKIELYRKLILDILDDYCKLHMFRGAVRFYKVVDQENNHYLVMSDGWWNNKRFYEASSTSR